MQLDYLLMVNNKKEMVINLQLMIDHQFLIGIMHILE